LKFGNFITKSARSTPYFIDTGNYRTGSKIRKLANFYADLIQNSGCEFDAIFGPAYKGIPLCVATTMAISELYGKDAFIA
jgi:orotate phosphoribosyltransferase